MFTICNACSGKWIGVEQGEHKCTWVEFNNSSNRAFRVIFLWWSSVCSFSTVQNVFRVSAVFNYAGRISGAWVLANEQRVRIRTELEYDESQSSDLQFSGATPQSEWMIEKWESNHCSHSFRAACPVWVDIVVFPIVCIVLWLGMLTQEKMKKKCCRE